MLGEEISDPNLVEGSDSSIRGLGYLKIRSDFHPEKTLKRVRGKSFLYNCSFKGYEIHHGQTEGSEERFAILEDAGGDERSLDGHYSFDGRVWGTYVHGIFDSQDFLQAFLNAVVKSDFIKFGFKPKARWQHFINFTNIVKESLDLEYINEIAKILIKK
jgi:adenosylcobyric acid synthase